MKGCSWKLLLAWRFSTYKRLIKIPFGLPFFSLFFIQVSWQRMTSKQTYSSSENLTSENTHGGIPLTKGCPGLMPKELVQRLSLQLQAALPTTRRDQLFGQVQTDIPPIGSQPSVYFLLFLCRSTINRGVIINAARDRSVSYTHLTLPTKA